MYLVHCLSEITNGDLYLHSRFDLFLPLHRLWLGYMSELLALSVPPPSIVSSGLQALPAVAGMHAKLVKADFHGSIITGLYTSCAKSTAWRD